MAGHGMDINGLISSILAAANASESAVNAAKDAAINAVDEVAEHIEEKAAETGKKAGKTIVNAVKKEVESVDESIVDELIDPKEAKQRIKDLQKSMTNAAKQLKRLQKQTSLSSYNFGEQNRFTSVLQRNQSEIDELTERLKKQGVVVKNNTKEYKELRSALEDIGAIEKKPVRQRKPKVAKEPVVVDGVGTPDTTQQLAADQESLTGAIKDSTGAISAQGKAFDKTAKRALNMAAAIKRYNDVMRNAGAEHHEINDENENTHWNIRDMVAQMASELRNRYTDLDILDIGDADERKHKRNERKRIENFIKAYEPYIGDLTTVIDHGSEKYDNTPKIVAVADAQKELADATHGAAQSSREAADATDAEAKSLEKKAKAAEKAVETDKKQIVTKERLVHVLGELQKISLNSSGSYRAEEKKRNDLQQEKSDFIYRTGPAARKLFGDKSVYDSKTISSIEKDIAAVEKKLGNGMLTNTTRDNVLRILSAFDKMMSDGYRGMGMQTPLTLYMDKDEQRDDYLKEFAKRYPEFGYLSGINFTGKKITPDNNGSFDSIENDISGAFKSIRERIATLRKGAEEGSLLIVDYYAEIHKHVQNIDAQIEECQKRMDNSLDLVMGADKTFKMILGKPLKSYEKVSDYVYDYLEQYDLISGKDDPILHPSEPLKLNRDIKSDDLFNKNPAVSINDFINEQAEVTAEVEKTVETQLKLIKKEGTNEYTALDGKYEIGQDADGWKVFQRDNAGLWNLIGTYKHFDDIKNDTSLLTREEIVLTDDVIREVRTLQDAYSSLDSKMQGHMPVVNKYSELLGNVKSGAMSAADAIAQLNDVAGVKTEGQVRTLEQVNAELEKEQKTLKEIEDAQARNDRNREAFAKKKNNYGREVLGVDHMVYDEKAYRGAIDALQTFNVKSARRNELEAEYLKIKEVYSKYYVGKYGIGQGEYENFNDFVEKNKNANNAHFIFEKQGIKNIPASEVPTNNIKDLLANLVQELRNSIAGIRMNMADGIQMTANIYEELEAEEIALNQEMQRLMDERETQMTKVNALGREQLDLMVKTGQREKRIAEQSAYESVVSTESKIEDNNKLTSSYEGLAEAVETYVSASKKLWEAYDKGEDYASFANERNESIRKLQSFFPGNSVSPDSSTDVAMYFQSQEMSRIYSSMGAEKALKDIEKRVDTVQKASMVKSIEDAYDAASQNVDNLREQLSAAEKEQEKLQKHAEVYGYTLDMDAKKAGRIQSILEKSGSQWTRSRAEAIPSMLSKGYVPEKYSDDYGLRLPAMSSYTNITKTEYEYALYLVDTVKNLNVGWEEGLVLLRGVNGQLEAAELNVIDIKQKLEEAKNESEIAYERMAYAHSGIFGDEAIAAKKAELAVRNSIPSSGSGGPNVPPDEAIAQTETIVQLVDNYDHELDEVNNKLMQGTQLLNEQAKVIRLFHNSSEVFDKFDTSKSGSVQGVPTLGKGNYLALRQDSKFNDAKYGRYQTQWYANVNKVFDAENDILSEEQINSIIDKFLPGLSDNDKNNYTNKFAKKYMAHAVKYLAQKANAEIADIWEYLGYDAVKLGDEINVFDSSKIHRANDIVFDVKEQKQYRQSEMQIPVETSVKPKIKRGATQDAINESTGGKPVEMPVAPVIDKEAAKKEAAERYNAAVARRDSAIAALNSSQKNEVSSALQLLKTSLNGKAGQKSQINNIQKFIDDSKNIGDLALAYWNLIKRVNTWSVNKAATNKALGQIKSVLDAHGIKFEQPNIGDDWEKFQDESTERLGFYSVDKVISGENTNDNLVVKNVIQPTVLDAAGNALKRMRVEVELAKQQEQQLLDTAQQVSGEMHEQADTARETTGAIREQEDAADGLSDRERETRDFIAGNINDYISGQQLPEGDNALDELGDSADNAAESMAIAKEKFDNILNVISSAAKKVHFNPFENLENNDDVLKGMQGIIDSNLGDSTYKYTGTTIQGSKGVVHLKNSIGSTIDAVFRLKDGMLELDEEASKFNDKWINFDKAGAIRQASADVRNLKADLGTIKYDGIAQLDELAKNINSPDDVENFKSAFKAARTEVSALKKEYSKGTNSLNDFSKATSVMRNATTHIERMRMELDQLGNVDGVDKANEALERMSAAAQKFNDAQTEAGQRDAWNQYNEAKIDYEAQYKYAQTAQRVANANKKAVSDEESEIRNYYKSILDTVNKINSLDVEIMNLKGKNKTGLYTDLIDKLQEEKNTLIGTLQSTLEEVKDKYGNGLANLETNVGGARFFDEKMTHNINAFMQSVEVQTALASGDINNFKACVDKLSESFKESEKIGAEAAIKIRQSFAEVYTVSSKLFKISPESGFAVGAQDGINENNKLYADTVKAYQVLNNARKILENKPETEWSAFESALIEKLTQDYLELASALESVIQKEQKAFAGMAKYDPNSGPNALVAQTDAMNSAAEKTNKTYQDLSNAADGFAKNLGANGAIITNFTQSADGISKLDFSVFDSETNSVRNFTMAVGQATEGIHYAETTVNKSLANMQAAKKQFQNAGDLISRLGAAGVDINTETATAEVKNLIDLYNKLKQIVNGEIEATDGDILDLAKRAKLSAAEVEKLYKKYVQLQEFSDAGGKTINLGQIDNNGNVIKQLTQNIREYASANNLVVDDIGKLNKKTGILKFTLVGTDGVVREFTADIKTLGKEVVAQETGVKEYESLWNRLKKSIGKTGKGFMNAFIGANVFHKALSELRKGYQYVKEIDSALTELKKVTDESELSYKNFLKTMSQYGREVSSTVSALTTSAADWARLNI